MIFINVAKFFAAIVDYGIIIKIEMSGLSVSYPCLVELFLYSINYIHIDLFFRFLTNEHFLQLSCFCYKIGKNLLTPLQLLLRLLVQLYTVYSILFIYIKGLFTLLSF